MPVLNKDLHGSAPDRSDVVLLLIDVINDFEFEGGDRLFRHALAMADRVAALKARCRKARIPVVYANDNFGQWRSDFHAILEHCLEGGVRGERIARKLAPDPCDYFVLKPKHSGFYATSLEILLEHLGAKTLILAGVAGDNCVFFTANDAYLRSYALVVPSDCIASIEARDNTAALVHMKRVLKVDARPSSKLDLRALVKDAKRGAKATRRPAATPSRG